MCVYYSLFLFKRCNVFTNKQTPQQAKKQKQKQKQKHRYRLVVCLLTFLCGFIDMIFKKPKTRTIPNTSISNITVFTFDSYSPDCHGLIFKECIVFESRYDACFTYSHVLIRKNRRYKRRFSVFFHGPTLEWQQMMFSTIGQYCQWRRSSIFVGKRKNFFQGAWFLEGKCYELWNIFR